MDEPVDDRGRVTSAPKMSAHALKGLLDATIIDARSWRLDAMNRPG